LAQALTRG